MENKFSFAKSLIKEVAHFIKEKMNDSLDIEVKSNYDDLVTNVDQEAQDFLIKRIKDHFPTDNILAEENNVRHPIDKGAVWVLDPIDGTVNFIVQGNNFAIMIAYYEDGCGQFGLIYDVMNDLLLSGGGSFDVYLNHKKLGNYTKKELNRCLIACNAGMFANNEYGIANLVSQTLGIRVYGGAGISMMKVFSQEILAYFSYIQPWDYAAAFIIGKKLGYTILTMDGKEPDFTSRQKVMLVPKEELATLKQILDIKEM
ncbi:inositol monophosphatase family protein [Streptococcus didelphis]|uniref:Inositol monophosphatase family protein n=1 Tax=Streptococcus didelphis TaxID=102886 RepID=A0ABY9LJC6_9STRE|nr:inositol monophosphatase family protein [Streptococcus didelphis]WMB28241.1 inositol monophosphatase family protein [Streptococcus didelphis]